MVKEDRVKVRTKRAGKRQKICNGKVLRGNEIVNVGNPPSLSVNIESFINNQTDTFDTSSSSFHMVEALFNSIPKYANIKNKDLSDAISVLSCPTCFQTTLAIIENKSKKRELACELSIFCSKCKYQNNFYTSKLVNKKGSFDINTRTIYTMRTLGIGHSGIQNLQPS